MHRSPFCFPELAGSLAVSFLALAPCKRLSGQLPGSFGWLHARISWRLSCARLRHADLASRRQTEPYLRHSLEKRVWDNKKQAVLEPGSDTLKSCFSNPFSINAPSAVRILAQSDTECGCVSYN